MRLDSGQLLVQRAFVADRLVRARMGYAVSHDDDGLLLWITHATPMALSVAEDGRGIRDVPFCEWIHLRQVMKLTTWSGPNVLMLIPPGASHSVWWFWDRYGDFAGWYVNLEDPSVIWCDGGLAGVDSTDHDLDIWVNPDLSWGWKDEDELAERQEFADHHWVTDPAAVRGEGERVIKLIEAGAFPFNGIYRDFHPDPAWRTPIELAPGWDRPRAHP